MNTEESDDEHSAFDDWAAGIYNRELTVWEMIGVFVTIAFVIACLPLFLVAALLVYIKRKIFA